MNKGMTLIEVIIAMAILSIVAVSVLMLYGTTISSIYRFGDDTEEVFADMETLEQLVATRNTSSVDADYTVETVTFTFNGIDVVTTGYKIEIKDSNIEYFLPSQGD